MIIESNAPGLLALALCCGLVLGMIYFGGLWFTVRKIPVSSSPQLLLFGSLLLRLGLCLGSFYLLLLQGRQLLVTAMIGFLLVRFYWLSVASKPGSQCTPLCQRQTKA